MKMGVEFTLGALLATLVTCGFWTALSVPRHAQAAAPTALEDLKQCRAEVGACYATAKRTSQLVEDSMAETREIACVCAKALSIPLDPRIKCKP